MARCGCASASCSCLIQEGEGINVTGAGSATNPYIVSAGDVSIGGRLTVQDTETVDLSLAGEGTNTEPFVLTADAEVGLNELEDVDTAAGLEGYVVAQDADGTFSMHPPVTTEPGLIEHDGTLQGDGSIDSPLGILEVATNDTLAGAGSLADPLTVGPRVWRMIDSGVLPEESDDVVIPVPVPHAHLRLTLRGRVTEPAQIGVRPKLDNEGDGPGIYRYSKRRVNMDGTQDESLALDGTYGWYIGEWGTNSANTAVIELVNADQPDHYVMYYSLAHRPARFESANVRTEGWGFANPLGSPVTTVRAWASGSAQLFQSGLQYWLEGIPSQPGSTSLEADDPADDDLATDWLMPWEPDPDVE